jgi:hypothetical protein
LTPFQEQENENNHGTRYYYAASTSMLHHVALMYFLRPNERIRNMVEAHVHPATPKDFDPDWSFGLPVRGKENEEKHVDAL